MATTEEKARLEARKLMADVNRLQTQVNSQTLASKAETDKLVAEINRLHVAAIKERDSDKARLAKEETRRLFLEQLAHIQVRQQNTREQLNRLMLAKQKYDQVQGGSADTMTRDMQLQQQLVQLIQRKKEEFVQLSKETEFIRQRAKQKGVALDEPQSPQAPAAAPTPPPPTPPSTTERAKAEAERLISEVRRPRAATSEKAEEVSKIIAEISKLQSAADKGLLSDAENRELETRIQHIESKQRQARDQINQLTQAKIKYELALARASQEKDAEKQRRQQDEKLQKELSELIKSKEDEQSKMLDELKLIKQRAEQEAAILKAQRDAARALAERQAEDASEGGPVRVSRKGLWASIAVSILVLVLGGGLGIVFLTSWFENGKPADTRPTPAPPSAAQPAAPAPQVRPVEKKPVVPGRTYRDSLKGGAQAPLMVELPDGTFLQGAAPHQPYSEELPRTEVTLRGFSISKYEITFKEYQDFARASGRAVPDDRGWGKGNRPVINVTWNDADAYAQWLTSETGKQYRLPSEREWEYAARAGSENLYGWGDSLETGRANCAVCGTQWDNQSTSPAGSFPPNAFGLHDMIGNAMEWTRSCYHPNYQGMPATGQDWEENADCSRRMVRGSAYNTYEKDLRVSNRLKYNPNASSENLGFRVVRVN